jgi:amino acid adenylation domain-containing protein
MAWSPTDLEPAPAGNQTLVSRFQAVVSTYPGHLAICGPGGSYTYQELDEASDRLAARLRTLAGPGDLVALLCGHDTGAVVAVWAVLKAGAAYVPLDPRQPSAWLGGIISDVFPAAVVCDPALSTSAAGLAGRPVLTVATERGGGTPLSADHLGDTPDSLAYILHTSGSTGRPKGVMQSNQNVLVHTSRFAKRLGIGPADRVPMVSRLAFDGAVLDMFGALLYGASLHIVDPYATEPDELLTKLTEVRATLLHCTPTLLRYLIGQAGKGLPVPALRWVALGGEEVTGKDAAGVSRYFPGAKLLNGFGATECTIALQHVSDSSDARGSTVPLGRAVPGIEARLIDPMGEPAEVFGELILAGKTIALGYWNQPGLTASAFGTGPDGTRYYRTGDLARRRPDGNLIFCGRIDFRVKIRGHRVEPAEAETVLLNHPSVQQAAVVPDNGDERGPRLIGYAACPGPLGASPAELIEYLRQFLPDFAVPTTIVVLEELPIGPTGKLNRSLLPVPAGEEPDHEGIPRRALEHRLAELWCRVLRRKAVGVRDNFFASGGDSLQVMELLDAINDEFGVIVPLRAFLSSPTLETLTGCVTAPVACRSL